MITTSDQIIGSKRLNATSFLYCGNVTPLVNYSEKINNVSSKISRMYNLVGCNGVDFVMKDNNVYVIEVNPRIQGTFENIETSFGFNLAEAHINSCNNLRVNIPHVKNFSVKLIPYSFKDAYYDLSNISNIHDVSDVNNLIKNTHPICTILTSDQILENAMIKAEMLQKRVYDSIVKSL
jgi:predicted ATP-grasp superfamily ATP-dependent carboligase